MDKTKQNYVCMYVCMHASLPAVQISQALDIPLYHWHIAIHLLEIGQIKGQRIQLGKFLLDFIS